MTVYFDYRVESPYAGQHLHMQWHRTYPLVAVACFTPSLGSTISVYSEEGHSVDDFALNKASAVTSLDWHPLKKALACGWESGDVAVYDLLLRELSSASPLHKHPVSIILWTCSGTRLVTGDRSGVLVIWRVDNASHIYDAPICQHRLRQELTYAINNPVTLSDYHASNVSSDAASAKGDETSVDPLQLGKNSRLLVTPVVSAKHETLFIATKDHENGNVFSLSDAGNAVQQFATDGPVKRLLFCDERLCLITLTTKMVMTVHNTDWNGNLLEAMKVKLSGKADDPDLILLGNGLLAYCTGESNIRVLDLHSHDNYLLKVTSSHLPGSQPEFVICLAYSVAKGVLCCGTVSGLICMWKYVRLLKDKAYEPEDCWRMQPSISFSNPVTSLMWGSSLQLLAVKTTEHIYILCEQVMSAHCSNGTVVIQSAPMQLTIEIVSTEFQMNFNSEIRVTGIYTTKDNFAVWDHRRVLVYEIQTVEHCITKVGDFKSSTSTVCLYNQNAYTLENGKVIARNLQGVVKQILPNLEHEGDILCFDVCSQFLVAATANNIIKIFDLHRSRIAKLFVPPKDLADIITGQSHITSVKCNSNASKVSISIAKFEGGNECLDSRLYIWDTDLDSIQFFNFATGLNQLEECLHRNASLNVNSTLIRNSHVAAGRCQTSVDVAGRYPSLHFFDCEDPRLLTVEAKLIDESRGGARRPTDCRTGTEESVMQQDVIVSLFVTSDNAVLIQDSFTKDLTCGRLLTLEIPYFYFAKKHFGQGVSVERTENEVSHVERLSALPSNNVALKLSPSLPLQQQHPILQSKDTPPVVNAGPADVPTVEAAATSSSSSDLQSVVVLRTHRDLIGFESADKATREALMNFSYCLCVGDMDKAFKAIKVIKSESIWETMAGMCIKSRRLDVARVCLGNMGNPRVAMALREAMKEPELDARVALLAIHLRLFVDAERLLRGCRRYDLLNRFYQAAGMWTEALDIARNDDRIHLRNTQYNYAKYSEDKGTLPDAIHSYESSMTHRVEVPRMLLAQHGDVEDYINKVGDVELYKWWGHFMESVGNLDSATQLYEQANDVFSLVKLFCSHDKLEKAKDVCVATGNRAACYVLANHLKKLNLLTEAVHFFTKAETYGPIIRICKENGFEEQQLINLALLGNMEDKIDVAEYYKKMPGQEDKAIMLYSKAGRISQAVQLAFQTKQYAALQAISESLTKLTEPALLLKSADFFVENFQFDMAVELLALAKRYQDALRICTDQHVPMTEDLVEKLTPPKEVEGIEEDERIRMLEAIAEVCFDQGQYHLATKKFIEAGNKVKAMKALLKSGDTTTIIYFAGVARQKEIYVLAANYLQSTDWNKDLETMNSIITFYKKGAAFDLLCNFYIACSQSEVDEFKNYEKALSALSEAYETLAKAERGGGRGQHRDSSSSSSSATKGKMNELKSRMAFIKQFVDAQSLHRANKTQDAIRVVLFLLKQPNIHHSVRVGDLLGFCISHYVSLSQWKPAYYYLRLLEKHTPKAQLTSFVDEGTIQKVLDALNLTLHEAAPQEPTTAAVVGNSEDGNSSSSSGAVQLPLI